MRTLFLIFAALAGCSSGTPTDAPQADAAAGEAVAGLYERTGAAATPDRICIAGQGTNARFGLVTWGVDNHSCTARGGVTGEPPALTLAIAGGPACTLRATVTASGLTLQAPDGAECAYYCGAKAAFVPGDFVRVGSSPADLAKATDIVGESLCP